MSFRLLTTVMIWFLMLFMLSSCGDMMSSTYIEDKITMELRLSKKQHDEFAKVSKHVQKMVEEFEKESRASLWHEELFTNETFSESRAYKLIDEKQEKLTRLFKKLVPKLSAFYHSLDVKQQAKFNKLLKRFIKSREEN